MASGAISNHGYNSGQNFVPFADGESERRGNLKSRVICIYMENLGEPVSLSHLSRKFGRKKETMRKALQRLPCTKRVDVGLYTHVPSECRNGVGQTGRGVITQNVPRDVPFDFPPELESFFDATFVTETHGHEFLSPSNWTVIDPSIEIEETREWKYCAAFFQIRGGRVHVQSRPKYKGHKYGLDSKRFLEYLEWIRSQLLGLVGSVPAIDLVRCDINQDRPISYDGPPIRVEVLEGILALQVYVVERNDWYWDLASNRLLRFEVINYGKPALDMAGKIQELLSRKAADIRSLDATERLLDTTRRVLKYNLSEFGHAIQDFREVVNKHGIAIEQNNELTKATAGLVLSVKQDVSGLGHELGQIGNQVLQEITTQRGYFEAMANGLNASLELQERQTEILSRLESRSHEIIQLIIEQKEVTTTWFELSRAERLQIYEIAKQNSISIRGLAKKLKTTHAAIIQYARKHMGQNGNHDLFKKTSRVQRFEILRERILAALSNKEEMTKTELRRAARCTASELRVVLQQLESESVVESRVLKRYARGRNPRAYFISKEGTKSEQDNSEAEIS